MSRLNYFREGTIQASQKLVTYYFPRHLLYSFEYGEVGGRLVAEAKGGGIEEIASEWRARSPKMMTIGEHHQTILEDSC